MSPLGFAKHALRAAQTEAKLKRGPIHTKGDANRTHYEMGKAIRGFITEQGGTMPEDLPTPEQSIQQLECAEQERVKAKRQPSHFLPDTTSVDDGEK
jgi:DNA-damage-inducible protein D